MSPGCISPLVSSRTHVSSVWRCARVQRDRQGEEEEEGEEAEEAEEDAAGGEPELYDPFAAGREDAEAAGASAGHKKQKTSGRAGSQARGKGEGKGKGKGKEAGEGGEKKRANDDDAEILRSLLGDSGVKSAMNHDALVGASNPEVVQANAEADRVARRENIPLPPVPPGYNVW
jgi:hypothetical protein